MVDSLKAFLKSINTPIVTFHLSMARMMFSSKSIRASSVDLLFLNPYRELLKILNLFINESSLFSNTFPIFWKTEEAEKWVCNFYSIHHHLI